MLTAVAGFFRGRRRRVVPRVSREVFEANPVARRPGAGDGAAVSGFLRLLPPSHVRRQTAKDKTFLMHGSRVPEVPRRFVGPKITGFHVALDRFWLAWKLNCAYERIYTEYVTARYVHRAPPESYRERGERVRELLGDLEAQLNSFWDHWDRCTGSERVAIARHVNKYVLYYMNYPEYHNFDDDNGRTDHLIFIDLGDGSPHAHDHTIQRMCHLKDFFMAVCEGSRLAETTGRPFRRRLRSRCRLELTLYESRTFPPRGIQEIFRERRIRF